MFQQLQREVSGGVVLGDMLIGLQVFLNVADAILYLMTVVDMQVSGELAGSLIYLDDGSEEVFYACTVLKGCGNHRDAEESAQGVDVHMVTTTLKLVIHVQGADHADVHIHQLGGQVEVAFQI